MVSRLRSLDRKLLRDLWQLRGQVAAIALVAACGVAIVVTTRTSYTSLLESRASYYRDYRFADVFGHLVRAPAAVRTRLAALPGVAAVESRVVADVTLDVPGLPEPATARLISVPARGRPALNDLYLRRGRWLEAGARAEALISEAFATANGLGPGDSLGAVINGRWDRLRVVGVVLSPEYVYEIGAGGLFPDNRRFGVIWMSEATLAPAFNMSGAFNDVSLTLLPGAREADVIAGVDRELERYGGLGAYGRADQVSARFLNDEIAQNRVSGTVVPAVFLGVAAFLLSVVLARLVATEREQIAVLKAFGYGDWAVGWHYLKFSVAALLSGSLGGLAVGFWFASRVNARYAEFYRFPTFAFRVDGTAVVAALLVTAVAATIGAVGAVRRVVRLPPAEAMRPEPPVRFHAGPLERLGLTALLTAPGRIIARNLERRPARAALTSLGIALAAAILVVGRFFIDAMLLMADQQFRHAQRENLTVVFNRPRNTDARFALAALPGVLRVEGYRSVAVRLRAANRSRRVVLTGVPRDAELRRVVGRDLAPMAPQPDGLLLTAKLGEVLGLAPGDSVAVEVLEAARAVRRVAVTGLVDELLGLNAYMDDAALSRLLRESPSLSGAHLRVDPRWAEALNARLKRLPAVAGVASRDAALASFEETLARSIGMMTGILIGFAGALAVAIVYNAARISLSERSRELASLRVLGFTWGEVSAMMLGEQALLTLIGIAAGLGLGYGFSALLAGLYQWEMFRIPLFVSDRTYAFAILVVALAAAATGLLVHRRIGRLDLVAVLKTRE